MLKLASSHYWRQLGFVHDPFPLNETLECYVTPKWQHYLEVLSSTERYRKALLLVLGEAGTGKTTLLEQASATLELRHKMVKLKGRDLNPEDLLTLLANRWQALPYNHQANLTIAADSFLDLLHQTGENYLLWIDEADSLPEATQALCFYLVKQQILTKSCLQIILSGRPSLKTQLDRLAKAQQETLQDFMIQTLTIDPLDRSGVEAYLKARLKQAGDTSRMTLLSASEMDKIYEASRGNFSELNRQARIHLQALVLASGTSSDDARRPFLGRESKKIRILLIILLALILTKIFWKEDLSAVVERFSKKSAPTVVAPAPTSEDAPKYPPGSHLIVNGQIQLIGAQDATTSVLPSEATTPDPNALQQRERVIMAGEIQNLPQVLRQENRQSRPARGSNDQ